ncbi:Protein kinase domain family protein [Aspergillus niger]|uniref:Protein kinase domain family protein n=1 Tax=Aspergillus niger TaxID=5061 RepID=A0A505I005_ASPNG|nr:Protein kinase domain family protein [Aspergillus niger]
MSSSDIQGYAIRRNNSCLSDEVGCGRTWETWHACCPSGSKCPGKEYSIQNNVCCPTWTDCTSEIKPAVCANSTWNMYDYDGYFCCTQDESGFRLKGTDWVGCLSPDSPGNASYSALRLISSGSGTNTGAIAGGVVGGVVGAAAIAGLLFYFLRRHNKQRPESQTQMHLQPQDPSPQYSAYAYSQQQYSTGASELDGQSVPAELPSTNGPKHELAEYR